nr:DUF5615 family PIN-like protein [uncultured Dyadobacter sp.]
MKFLFDENISYRIVKKLRHGLSECLHVSQTPLRNACSDRKIWDYAKANGYIIVTCDEDFKYLADLYGFPPKVILLRTGNSSTTFIAYLLENRMSEIVQFHESQTYGLLEMI